MVLSLTQPSIQAVFHALSTTEAKGRVALRVHNRLTKLISAECTVQKDSATIAKPGSVDLDESLFEYLKDAIYERVDAGIPGSMAFGYGELIDLMETASKTEE